MDDQKRAALEDRLIQQWKEIEELEADEGSNVDDDRFKVTKEQWFLQAFAFLRDLPEDSHCWCGHREIMLPLLEPFYLFYEETSSNSSLKVLWSRLCKELRSCTSCVVKHHKAKEFYISEFMEDVVKPLLDIIRALDEERVAGQMKELLAKFDTNSLDPNEDSASVICVMFEVLMFPLLLEDAEINDILKPFLIHVEESHDLSLASGQRYPGVYSLLCHADQGVRRIALKLAHSLPSFKDEQELESIQSFLQRCLHCLESDAFDSSAQRTDSALQPSQRILGRPRVGFSKEALWIGLTTILGLLEAPAFLKGVLERYPVFVSIVLNHVSEATSVFWNALRCLKLLLEVLGYKLWLGMTFSPGVMRNTLLSQCFHSHEERMHVHIFDLFQPFLQSLEALQDGEYENQRRRLLYFLLMQVPCSSNFKPLVNKKARQVAFSIVGRGYTMDPPLPPVECVHVWGPPLVATLKDTSLMKAVRQSAIDLMQSIFVADAAALAAVTIQQASTPSARRYMLDIGDDDFDSVFEEEMPNGEVEVVADIKYSMSFLSVTRSVEACEEWSCLPLIWIEVLSATLPVSVPRSFTKSIMWALSRLSLVDLEAVSSLNSGKVDSDVIACSDVILTALQWVKPKGYDDGAGGKGCANAVKAKAHLKELVGILKRQAESYVNRLGDRGFEQQEAWVWEPRMAEPVVLLLLDANSVFKDFGKEILRRTANASTLENGLELLCTSEASAAAVSRGLHYASKLFLRWPLTQCARGLQQLFFHVWKLLVLGETPEKEKLTSLSQVSQDGGFLSQPTFPSLSTSTETTPSTPNKIRRDEEVWSRLCRVVASHIWPLLEKTLFEGRQYVDGAGQLMTFTRMLQLLPLVCRHLDPAHKKRVFTVPSLKQCSSADESSDLTWFQALVRWGDLASAIIQRWWKEAVVSILEDLKKTQLVSSSIVEDVIVEFRKPGFSLGESCKLQLGKLLQSLSTTLESQGFLDNLPRRLPKVQSSDSNGQLTRPSITGTHVLPSRFLKDGSTPVRQPEGYRDIIDLTEDEDNYGSSSQSLSELSLSSNAASASRQPAETLGDYKADAGLDSTTGSTNRDEESLFKRPSIRHRPSSTLDNFLTRARIDQLLGQASKGGVIQPSGKSTSFKPPGYKKYNTKPQKPAGKLSSLRAEHRTGLEQRAGVEDVVRMQVRERVEREERAKRLAASESATSVKKDLKFPTPAVEQASAKAADPDLKTKSSDAILRQLVIGNEADPLDQALENVRKTTGLKDLMSKPRRQLVRLELPGEGGKGGGNVVKTPELVIKPRVIPRMDDWYRRILSLNYLSLVGVDDDDLANFGERLEKVPLTFNSSDQYMEIFRPLLMDEFKAQLQRSYEELNLSDNTTTGVVRLMSLERVDDFQLGRFMAEAGSDAAPRSCAENDLILLSRQPMSVGQQSCHLLAKVESRERESKSRATILLMKIYINMSDPRLTKAKRLLVDRTLQEKITAEYNESQIRAIAFAIGGKETMTNTHQLTLVQGPPGTGKTRTIVAVVSALLAVKSPRRNPRTGKENSHLPSGLSRSTNMSAAARNSLAISRSWQDAAIAKQMMKDNDSGFGDGPKQRVLVCAQSNAAVDEIVARILKNGLYGANGAFFRPSIVRIGAVKSVHPNSLPVFIDTLVNQRLGAEKDDDEDAAEEKAQAKLMESRAKLEDIIEFIQVLEALLSQAKGFEENEKTGQKPVNLESDLASKAAKIVAQGPSATTGKLNLLYKQRREISAELATAEKEGRKSWEESQNKRKAIRKQIIRQADVVVTTLSGCGGDIYTVCMESIVGAKKHKPAQECFFDAVVIDEAGQALEPATLIPFQLLAQVNARCVMVGDPKQLPATVLSQHVSKMAYERSMFERLQRAGYPVTMLSTQYRMHPEIREFPSAHFYDNLITDGPGLKGSRKAIFHRESYLGPYVFFDVVDGKEGGRGNSASQSISNEAEVEVVLQLYLTLKKRYSAELWEGRVGVITPYKQQLRLLQEQFTKTVGSKAAADVEFNTVDGFQGREVDIIILSTVRASPCSNQKSGGIGFVADVRRMNVALTRARFSCWVVGNAATLQANASWDALLKNAKKRSLFFPIQKPYASFFQKKGSPPVPVPDNLKPDGAKGAKRLADEETSGRRVSTHDTKEFRPVNNRRREDSEKRFSEPEMRPPAVSSLQLGSVEDGGKQSSVDRIEVKSGKPDVRSVELLKSGVPRISESGKHPLAGNSRQLEPRGAAGEDGEAHLRDDDSRSMKAELKSRKEERLNGAQEDRAREERKRQLVRVEGQRVGHRSSEPSQRHGGDTSEERPAKKVISTEYAGGSTSCEAGKGLEASRGLSDRSRTDEEKSRADYQRRKSRLGQAPMDEKSHERSRVDDEKARADYEIRKSRQGGQGPMGEKSQERIRADDEKARADYERRKSKEGQASLDEKTQERLRQAQKYVERSKSDLSQSKNGKIPEVGVDRHRDRLKTASVDDTQRRSSEGRRGDKSRPDSVLTNLREIGEEKRLQHGGLSRESARERRTGDARAAVGTLLPKQQQADSHSRRSDERSVSQDRRTSREAMLAARKRQREEASAIVSSRPPSKRHASSSAQPSPPLSGNEHRAGQLTAAEMAVEGEQFQRALKASKSGSSNGVPQACSTSHSSSVSSSKANSASNVDRSPPANSTSALDSILSGLSSVTRAQAKGGYSPSKSKDQTGDLSKASKHP
ncbi:hypothetical protein Mapa_003016 [Marchantia paleacea]|nr:hypothetical protein Mapa_003016 [Marchantia paleacea]